MKENEIKELGNIDCIKGIFKANISNLGMSSLKVWLTKIIGL